MTSARSGVETKVRIIAAARRCFGRSGYDLTTNKDIASEAGVTTGALYHYFDSKPDLFVAVHEQLNARMVEEFSEAAATETTLVGQIRAILNRAVDMNRQDPSLGNFSVIAATELQRHPELAAMVPDGPDGPGVVPLLSRLVRAARRRGELAADVDTTATVNMLAAVGMGLAQFGALIENAEIQQKTSDAFMRAFDGVLFRGAEVATRSG